MCLAVPLKVIKIKENSAIVQSDKHTHKADLSLVKNVKVGDYLLVHAGLALNKLQKKEVKDILKIIKSLNHKIHGK